MVEYASFMWIEGQHRYNSDFKLIYLGEDLLDCNMLYWNDSYKNGKQSSLKTLLS